MGRRRGGDARRGRSLALAVVAFAAGSGLVVALSWGAEPAPDPRAIAPLGERVRVEVLNAGGVRGMAREATLWLRDVGFDVVDIGNADAFDPERASTVIDRVGRPDLARSVADALGIDIVLSQPDPNLYVDVSVLLGSDWIRPDLRAGPSGAPVRARWDPRRWMGR